jgi:hypothetical protein
VNSGVTIDLSYLNTTLLSSDRRVASVGAGARWFDVYEVLEPFNVTIPGGRNGDVGVGGLTIGGGISYFGPRVGWTCDSVLNFEVWPLIITQAISNPLQVVLASGAVVNANQTSNPSLFRALKGGANNFGIVTRIDYMTFEQGDIWGGTLIHPISALLPALDAFSHIAARSDYDIYGSINTILDFNSSTKAWIIIHQPVYTKETVGSPPLFDELLDIQPQLENTLAFTNLTALSMEGLSSAGGTKL